MSRNEAVSWHIENQDLKSFSSSAPSLPIPAWPELKSSIDSSNQVFFKLSWEKELEKEVEWSKKDGSFNVELGQMNSGLNESVWFVLKEHIF